MPLRTKFVIGKPIYTVKPHFTGMEACHVFSSSCARFFYKDLILQTLENKARTFLT